MARQIKITAVEKTEPDVRLAVLALLQLARELQEAQAAGGSPPADAGDRGGGDG
jgi:hypothetical protein